MFILSLPIPVSVVLCIVLAVSFSVGLYFVFHRVWSGDITGDTKKTADNVATRIGVIHAVILGMMFTSVRVEYNQMIVAIESEASALTRLYNAIRRQDEKKFLEAREQVLEYIHFIVDEQWPALRELHIKRIDGEITGITALDRIWQAIDKIEYKPGDLNIRALLDEVENHRIQRLFDVKGGVLPVFWYIAIIGYLLTLLPLYLPAPTFRRCLLISFYSSMVAVVLLGVFILTYPYSPAAGISPDMFNLLLEGAGR